MTLEQKITIKGKMEKRGANMRLLVAATAKDLCFYWRMICGRPITDFAKS